jgi:anti-sigma factor RsiW
MTIRGDQHIDEWMEVAVDYLDGRVDAATKAAVEEHLVACPKCAERLRSQQTAVHVLQDALLYDPPEDLEYRTLGELVFPSPGGKPVYEPSGPAELPRGSRLARRLRPWVPVGVAVAALLMAVVGYGIVRSGADQAVTGADVAGTFSTEAKATDTPEARTDGLSAVPSTTTAEGAATSVAETAPSTTAAVTAVAMTADRKKMIKELESAQAPTYVAFMAQEATVPSDSQATQTTGTPDTTAPATGTETTSAGGTESTVTETSAAGSGADTAPRLSLAVTPEQAAEVVSQMAEFSGLEPLDESLWLDGPTYAVYLPRIDAEELVDLVRSIGASIGLLVVMRDGPPGYAMKAVAKLMEHKKFFPILEAARAPQPATWGFSFTTSTLVDASGAPAGGTGTGETSSTTLPDQSGDHVLLVIYVQRGAEQ